MPTPDEELAALEANAEQPARAATVDDLRNVADMAARILKHEEDIEALEGRIKEEKKALQRLQETDLPNLLTECGLSDVRLATGHQIEIKTVVQASWPAAKAPEERSKAVELLRENGALDLVKCEVTAAFSVRDRDAAVQMQQEMSKSNSAVVTMEESVHNATLVSWLRGRRESGQQFEFPLLKTRVFKRAVVS